MTEVPRAVILYGTLTTTRLFRDLNGYRLAAERLKAGAPQVKSRDVV